MGAWGHRAYDNDTGEEWLDGLADSLKFMLLRAFWSRWQEEGIAAAKLLCDLPQVLQDHIPASELEEFSYLPSPSANRRGRPRKRPV